MNNTVVVFDMDRCHMELNYPYALENMTLAKLKKVFAIMCTEGYRNTEAIRTTEKYIAGLIAEASDEWRKASDVYRDGYKDTQFDLTLSATQRQRYERHNAALLRTVSNKKKAYERCLKMLNYFADTKAKYNVS